MQAIDEMVREITRELFLEAATAEVMAAQQERGAVSEAVAADPDAILHRVVAARIEGLDDTFLAVLNTYIEGAAEKGRTEIAELLQLLKDEVLRQVAGRLAPELQVLNAALRAPARDARLDLVRRFALAGPGQGGVVDVAAESEGSPEVQLPYCGRDELARATAQVLEDMEGAAVVVDRKLLARVVLLQEELAELAAAEGDHPTPPPPSSAEAMGAVPRAVAAFVKELVGVGSEEQRRALLRKAFSEDWILGAASPGRGDQGFAADTATTRASSAGSAGMREPAGGSGSSSAAKQQQREQLTNPQEVVRPGRFMQGINALQAEMQREGGAVAEEVLLRVGDVRREALLVLADLAGEGQPFAP